MCPLQEPFEHGPDRSTYATRLAGPLHPGALAAAAAAAAHLPAQVAIKDLFAGLALCAVLVPVGLSYAALGIIEVRNVQRPWRIHRNEFAVSILSFVGVVTLGALPGILIAVGLALISFVWRTRSRPFGKPDSY